MHDTMSLGILTNWNVDICIEENAMVTATLLKDRAGLPRIQFCTQLGFADSVSN